MKPLHLVVLILVGVGIMLGVTLMQKKQGASGPVVVKASGPPADAAFLDPEVQPLDVATGGGAFTGQWVKAPGWQVGITNITPADSGGKALRIELPSHPTMRGMSAWLVAIVPEDEDIKKGDFCVLSGRIDSVDKFHDGYAESLRVVMRDVTLTKIK